MSHRKKNTGRVKRNDLETNITLYLSTRKLNEADKERFKREKDAYDRGVGVAVTTTVRIAAPPPAVQEAGTVQCIR